MPTIVLRSLLGRLGVAVVGLIGLYPVAVIWLADGYGHGLQALSAAFAVTVAAWLLWWRPLMRLDQESIRVRNAFRSHRVAWDAVTDVQSRWGLVLVLADAGDDAVDDEVLSENPAVERAHAVAHGRGRGVSVHRRLPSG